MGLSRYDSYIRKDFILKQGPDDVIQNDKRDLEKSHGTSIAYIYTTTDRYITQISHMIPGVVKVTSSTPNVAALALAVLWR